MAISGPNVGGAAGATGSAKNSMTPGFLGGAGGGEKPVGLNARNEKGASVLGAAENVAAGADISQNNDDLDGAREDEENVGSVNYTGSGREEQAEEQVEGRGFFSINKGPIAIIIGLFMSLVGVVGFGQMSLPFSMLEELRMSFNTMQTSVSNRSNVIFKYQLGKDVKNPVKSKFWNKNSKFFKLSSKQETKLKQNGIEIVDGGNGKSAMKMTDSSGQVKYIVPSGGAGDYPNLKGGTVMDFETAYKTDTDFFKAYKNGSLTWRGAVTNWFESATTKFLSENKLTRNLFENFRQKVDENGGDMKATTVDLMSKGTDELVGGGRVMHTATSAEVEGETDQKVITGVETKTVNDATRINLRSEADVQEKVGKLLKGVDTDTGGGISGAVQTGTSIICGVADVIGMGTLLVAGAEAMQIMRIATAYFEAIDKVRSGEGDDSPINPLMNALTGKTKTVSYDFEGGNVAGVDGAADNEDAWRAIESNANAMRMVTTFSKEEKSAMEAEGMVARYSGKKVNPNDPSVKSFNFSGSIKRIVGGLGVSMGAFSTCAAAKLGANAWGVVEGAIEWIPCVVGIIGAIFTLGGSAIAGCSGAVANVVLGVVAAAAISGAIAAVVGIVLPVVTKLMTRNLIADLAGEDLGNAIVSGANMYMGDVHRYNGGSLGDVASYTQFAMEQQSVIAEEAEYERLTKSPFDITSRYTFMGSLMQQLMKFAGVNSIMSAITSTNIALSSSIASITPAASALDTNSMLVDNYDEVCPYLASIGAVGDAYCNPYAITDVSTIYDDPSAVVDNIKESLIIETIDDESGESERIGCEGEDESCENLSLGADGIRIKGNSQLAKYITYCDKRSSGFGIMDQNISNDLANFSDVRTASSTINSITNGTIGGVPIYGDLVDVVQNSQKIANMGYITGASCVAGNDGPAEGTQVRLYDLSSLSSEEQKKAKKAIDKYNKDKKKNEKITEFVSVATPSWDKAKYYQRFIEDQSLMESMGIIEKSAVTAFLEENDLLAPVDNSFEGMLAKYSGLSKETVVDFMDIMEYYDYIANYDPTTRYAFGQDIRPTGTEELRFDNDQKVAYVVLLNTIEFADVRNRSFVV